jgi:hypothetical protein
MYKAGDRVRIISLNTKDGKLLPGGEILDKEGIIGEVVTLVSYRDRAGAVPSFYYQGAPQGYWIVSRLPHWNHRYVFNECAFELVKPLTYLELYAMAKERNIPGRSKMSKIQLHDALHPKPNEAAKKAVVPPPPPPPPVYKTLFEELKANSRNQRSVCSYAMREGESKFMNPDDVCHARFTAYGSVKGMEEIVLNICGHYAVSLMPEAYKAFCIWMFNESPFKTCFITKDFDDALANGVQLDVNKPHSWNVTSAIALRMGSEFPKRLELWDKLRKEGVSGGSAWIIASFFTFEGTKYAFYANTAAHCVHNHAFNFKKYLKLLREGLYHNNNYPLSSVSARSYVVSECLTGQRQYDITGDRAASIGQWLKKATKLAAGALFGKENTTDYPNVLAAARDLDILIQAPEIVEAAPVKDDTALPLAA